jgi:AAA15 family ATPase/GTPase
MYISDIRIQNYKSYRDSRALELGPGINVIVGKNNVGKTALLDALSLRFGAVPHRSLNTLPSETRSLKPKSTVEFTFTLSKEELLDLLIDAQPRGNAEFRLPLPDRSDPSENS